MNMHISMYHIIIVCTREDALSSILANLEIYSEQTKEAKKLGADIIVFPEVLFYLANKVSYII